MSEKNCEICGAKMLVKSPCKRFCNECVAQRKKAYSKNYKQQKQAVCNPPSECSCCNYDDCIRDGDITRAETQIIKELKLKTEPFLPIASDVKYRRNRRLI